MLAHDREQLERALALLEAGEHRKALVITSSLGAPILPQARVPRAAWVAALLREGRFDDARVEMVGLLARDAAAPKVTVEAPPP